MFEKKYWLAILISLLFFVFGFSFSYYLIGPNSNSNFLFNTPSQDQEENTTSTEESKSKRKTDYLFSEVKEIKKEGKKIILRANIDLSSSFADACIKNAERNFFIEEGTTSVYQIESSNLSDKGDETISPDKIEVGDEVAIMCGTAPQTIQELLTHKNYSVKEIIIVKPEN